jgi:hypothetical protein
MTSDGKNRLRSPIERLILFFERCVANAFFGKVTVVFQNGRVCDVRIEQIRKMDEL